MNWKIELAIAWIIGLIVGAVYNEEHSLSLWRTIIIILSFFVVAWLIESGIKDIKSNKK